MTFDIAQFYSPKGAGPGSSFWVACNQADGLAEQIVGCVGLQSKSASQAELRRLSVSREFRGCGVANALCKHLLQHAQGCGFQEVVLTTSVVQTPAIALYTKLGWKEIGTSCTPDNMLRLKTFTCPLPRDDSLAF
eukprot:GGOE01043135.1.p1 GENE.GGOE01043135.1~~GGOE01043135.1.p1  ORF type:complete len:135 (-),score=33.03 GGOE01043135.1:169-573(-)